ncbi:MAG: hypothetical protein PVH18_08345 [Chloroflexota bacterium]|jgi:hypothetical protein
MERFLFGLFIVLHGFVHLWYFTLSQKLVEFQPEMGWHGESWLLSKFLGDLTRRSLASGLYVVAALAFVLSGIGIFSNAGWSATALAVSATFSSATILLFWDGETDMLMQKGFIGLLINVLILIVTFLPT